MRADYFNKSLPSINNLGAHNRSVFKGLLFFQILSIFFKMYCLTRPIFLLRKCMEFLLSDLDCCAQWLIEKHHQDPMIHWFDCFIVSIESLF